MLEPENASSDLRSLPIRAWEAAEASSSPTSPALVTAEAPRHPDLERHKTWLAKLSTRPRQAGLTKDQIIDFYCQQPGDVQL